MKGLAFDYEFVLVVPRIGRGARVSEAFVDLSSLEAKLDDVQDGQRSIIVAISELKTMFIADFSTVLAAVENFRPSARRSTDVGGCGDVGSSSDVSILNCFCLYVYIFYIFC